MKQCLWLFYIIVIFAILFTPANAIIAKQDTSPVFDYSDALMPPDLPNLSLEALSAVDQSPSPGYYETSEYLIGKVAVGIIFLESNGTIDPSTENWTPTRESQVVSEIQGGLSWLASYNPNARVSLVYDIHYRVPTRYEPINHPYWYEQYWMKEAMTYLGYPGTYYFTQVRDYINALRITLGTDWAYTIFVVDSYYDADGAFTDGYFAYAYLGGPFLVMTYDNDNYGIGSMDFVTAHETGHIFFATDEYDNVIEYSGYLNSTDTQYTTGCFMGQPLGWPFPLPWSICVNTQHQLGWRDTDGDGIQDIVDVLPNTVLNSHSPDPTNETILSYSGNVSETPYPNNNPYGTGRDVTINKMTKVEFTVDAYPFSNAQPSDGNFDEAEESFTFVTSSHRPRNHTVYVKGVNSVGNSAYAVDRLTTLGSSSQEWNKTFAEPSMYSPVIQTQDGGYAIAGYTGVFPNYDAWLAKLDSTGDLQWSRTYGGSDDDEAYSLVQTSDGGYALAGYTNSFGAGGSDFWLIKTDSQGNMKWMQTYGGTNYDSAWSIRETSDGGYVLAGETRPGAGWSDYLLVKTNSNGNMLWSKTYGGTKSDSAFCVVQASDGGYAVVGYTLSYGAGGADFWLVKTDASGNKLWAKTYGGSSGDYAYSLVQASDAGYTLTGYTYSFGAGNADFWLVKTDSAGNMQWSKTYGGTNNDYSRSIVKTSDNCYVIVGYTYSFGVGGTDYWLVKTDASGNLQWDETYGGTNYDSAYAVIATSDGGYALSGRSGSYPWLVKVSPAASKIRVPMDYLTIQKAINIASPSNSIQVAQGTYYERLVVNKTVTLTGENRETTIIDGNKTGIPVWIAANNVTIGNFTIQKSTQYQYGIYVSQSSGVNILNNFIINNNVGVMLWNSDNVQVINNTITSNNIYGLMVDYGTANLVSRNNIASNGYGGIYLWFSSFNVLRDNSMTQNGAYWNSHNLDIQGDTTNRAASLLHYMQDIDSSNTINGMPILYFMNLHDFVIDSNSFPSVGYLGVVNSTKVDVEGLSVSSNGQGILFAHTKNSTITNTNVHDNAVGIQLVFSDFNLISNSSVGLWNGRGIEFISSNGNTVTQNTLLGNYDSFRMVSSDDNILIRNDVKNTYDWLLMTDAFSSNIIYHNNFTEYSKLLYGVDVNIWDNGYEGNYWSDYTGTDTNDDGIGDTYLPWQGVDYYPLMYPYKGHNIAVTDIKVNKTVVGQGHVLEIDVEVVNVGSFPQTFNVTIYANTTAIQTQAVTLAAGESTTLRFYWDTTETSYGDFSISVQARPVPDETQIVDNTSTYGTIFVTVPGDVNGDGRVDTSDLFDSSNVYGTTSSALNWDPNCDINGDNKVDVSDLFELGKNYGKTTEKMGSNVGQDSLPVMIQQPLMVVFLLVGIFQERKRSRKPRFYSK